MLVVVMVVGVGGMGGQPFALGGKKLSFNSQNLKK
jgi:hypothetical protein